MEDYYIYGYVFMWLVTAAAIKEEMTFNDTVSSLIAALGWPILICSRLLRKII